MLVILFIISISYVAVFCVPFSSYFIVKFFVTLWFIPYSLSAGLIFTLELVLVSVIISDVISGVCFVPSAYVTSIFPPSNDKVSPCPYDVFVGAVISIVLTVFFTVISNVFCIPSYSTVIVCFPVLFALYPLTVTLLSVKSTAGSCAPLAITFCTFPPVKSNASPYLYSVFVGAVSVMSFT